MKKHHIIYLAAAVCSLSIPGFSQEASDSTTLGLPGDNLDLYAVLDLFQKSKTIEDFEKSLNDPKTKINNLDLDLDTKVDFIKVVTKNRDSSFTFVLQDDVSKTETQDVAVILVDKDKKGKVTMQIVGDKELYGKDYIVEPQTPVTANPGYTGSEPATTTKTVVVESAPVVQYVYSPVYVPYMPPYYYGYYPPYYAAFTVMAVGIYHSNHYYYHGGGYGYHHTTVIVNHNHYNNYNGQRNVSNTVSHNNVNGRYNNGNGPNQRPSNGNTAGTRPSTTPSNRRSDGSSAGPSDMSRGGSNNRANNSMGNNNNRANNNVSRGSNNRQSPSNNMSPSRGGGGRSMGGGGYGGGGGGRGGGGGGGGRRR